MESADMLQIKDNRGTVIVTLDEPITKESIAIRKAGEILVKNASKITGDGKLIKSISIFVNIEHGELGPIEVSVDRVIPTVEIGDDLDEW